jgi:hypothetical protein
VAAANRILTEHLPDISGMADSRQVAGAAVVRALQVLTLSAGAPQSIRETPATWTVA